MEVTYSQVESECEQYFSRRIASAICSILINSNDNSDNLHHQTEILNNPPFVFKWSVDKFEEINRKLEEEFHKVDLALTQ